MYSSDSATCSGNAVLYFTYADTTVNCDSLSANYNYSYSGGLNITAYNTSTIPWGAYNAGLRNEPDWFFGDGIWQVNANMVNHTYSAAGTYNLMMINR